MIAALNSASALAMPMLILKYSIVRHDVSYFAYVATAFCPLGFAFLKINPFITFPEMVFLSGIINVTFLGKSFPKKFELDLNNYIFTTRTF